MWVVLMKKRRIVLSVLSAIVVVPLGWCLPGWLWGPALEAIRIQPRDLSLTLVVNGRVLAPSRVQIGVQITGVVSRRCVEEGDRVRTGQLLLELDSAQAQAGLDKAQAVLDRLREAAAPADRASLAQAESALRLSERQHERNRHLYQEGVIPLSQLEESAKNLESARALQASAQAWSQSTNAGSDLRVARAELDLARVALAQTRVLSPADAVVLSRSVEAGDQVQPGRTLLVLALDEPLQLFVQPDERHLAQLSIGQEALASADAFPDRRFSTRISRIAPGIDATRGTVDVRLTLSEPADFLRPDMTVSVEILCRKTPKALVVPLQALRGGQNDQVLVLRSGRAVKAMVRLGQRGESEAEVQEGLQAGDIVLLAPAAREGERCRARLDSEP